MIRSWRDCLGITPGEVRRSGPSPLAERYLSDPASRPAGYALYL
jgi:hypothetical protein